MEMAPEGTETVWREGLERSEDLSGQEGCEFGKINGRSRRKRLDGQGTRGGSRESQERVSATTF